MINIPSQRLLLEIYLQNEKKCKLIEFKQFWPITIDEIVKKNIKGISAQKIGKYLQVLERYELVTVRNITPRGVGVFSNNAKKIEDKLLKELRNHPELNKSDKNKFKAAIKYAKDERKTFVKFHPRKTIELTPEGEWLARILNREVKSPV